MADKYTWNEKPEDPSKRNQNSADGISPKDPSNSTDKINFNKNGLIPGKLSPADKRKISTAIQFGGGEFIGITRNLTDLFSPSARNVTPGATPQGSGASAYAVRPSTNYYAEGRASPNPQTQPPGKTFRIKTVGSSGEEGFFDVTKEEDLDNFINDIHAGKYGDINKLKSDTTQPLAARIATMNQGNERGDITGILKRAFKDSNSPEEIASKLNKELDESYNVWTYFKNKKKAVPDYEEFRKDPQKYTDSLSPEEKAELETLIPIDEETNEFRKKNIGRQERFAHFKAEDFASIEPEPEPEPDLEPDFEKIETAYADLYRGVGMSNIVGRNGMGTGDSAINDAVLERERQGAAQEEAKLAQNKAQIRAFNHANYGTQIHLQAQKFLDETRYLPQAERREAYDNFIQTLLANESLSPNAPGLSDEERYDRNVTMQNALNQLALNTQQAMQEYDREAFIADKTGQIQSLISLAQDEKNAEQDEVNYRAMMTQIAQLKTVMPPMQYRKIKMDAAVSFTNTVNSREIQEAIKKAAQTQSLVDVNEVMKKVNQNIEEGYFTILADIQDGDKTFGQLFKNNITTASIQHRNALLEYNENLFKQREGQFQVWNNNGFLNRAAEQGKFWRDELEEAINNGSVDRNFYYQSKDFYRPLAVGESPSGGIR